MDLLNIHGHTVDKSMLGDSGAIIDIGCRDFNFASYFKGRRVYCVDPDQKVFADSPAWAVCLQVAIMDRSGSGFYYENGERTCVQPVWPEHRHCYFPCTLMTLEQLFTITGPEVDVLKLDCEGAEYAIFGNKFDPVARQITVEFHRHTVPEVHDEKIDCVMHNLLEHYDLIYSHETGMDNLFVLK